MTKLGIFVGEDKWTFLADIYEDLADHYLVETYKRKTYDVPLLYGRLNRYAFRRGMKSVLRHNDVCFFEWASDLLAPASQLPKECAVITRLHSFELYDWAPKIDWNFVDKVILVSEAMRRRFGDLYPDHLHKAEVIYNGVSLTEFKPPEQRIFDFNVGMLCNIKPVKRVYETILMIDSLRDQGCDARLHIAGEPEGDLRYAEANYRLVEKLGLEDAVQFYGRVSDTPEWLEKIDVFVSNSYWEGHQVALIEAMAAGCYCLAHFWDGAEETLPMENLFASETELQQKIIEYASLSETERRKRQALMRSIANQKFDIEQTKGQIRRVIEETARAHQSP